MKFMISALSMYAKKIKIGDLIIVSLIVLLSIGPLIAFYIPKGSTIATVSQDGKVLFTVDLSDPLNDGKEFAVQDDMIIRVENGNVFVKQASCPDKICVASGKLSDTGVICCLPHKILISVQNDTSDLDVITK